ncbi:MAG TPA: Rossmann-like and DUF2520 domain-containing protein [Gaiellaceae bacterium]|nr:Rossmann-like and DUF2520 domain-containing protein [Gaiellaceae bacterium]
MEFTSACVVGAGRVGSAVAARLAERLPTRLTGRELETGGADLVLLCVPDRAIPEVAAALEPGPWIAHTSGARTLDALDPHRRRFGLHPLQTFVPDGGPGQLDGSWAAVSGESDEAREAGLELARLLRLKPFVIEDEEHPLYHAAAAIASNFLVTIHWAAAELFEAAGAPPEALLPLMRRTMENGFELTGPISRGDWETVERHLEVIRESRPELEPMYRALTDMTAAVAAR